MIVGPPRTASISSRRTFEALSAEGRRGGSGPIRIRYLPDDADRPRVAYAIPRRTGSAVARNRLRRRLRAAVDQVVGEMAPGAYLVSPDPAVTTMALDDVIASLRKALAVAGAVRRDEQ